jgi:site-specific DNA recombinase
VKVALYARVSSDDQADRETIKDQILYYEKWIDLHGHTDGGRFLDDGVTGTLPMPDRPGGSKLLEAIKRGEVSCVAFKNVKRLGRKTRVVLDFIDTCDQAGATITSITEPFSTADPIGRFIVTILASISELDRENILEQTRAGMRRRAREGGFLGGKAAYAYAIEGRRHQARLILDESESGAGCTKTELVQRIYEDLADGSSCDAIATRLNAQGVPSWSGGQWSASALSRMVKNPVYRGQHRHGDAIEGSILPVSYSPAPRIVSDALWERAQAQIEKNRRLSGRAANRLYLLRGLLWCGQCGHAYTGLTMNAAQADATEHRKGVIYRCNWRASGQACSSPSVSGEIEAEIWQAVQRVLENPAAFSVAMQARVVAPRQDGSLERLQRALAEKAEARARILSLYRRGRLTDTELDAQMDEIEAESATLSSELDALRSSTQQIELALAQAQSATIELAVIAERVKGRLDNLTRTERHAILNQLVERVTVEAGEGSINLAIRFKFVPPDCNTDTRSEGQLNLIQQMVTDWGLPELQAKLLG